MSKEFQIRDGNLIASFDLENGDGDIDFCKLLKVSQGVVEEIGMFVDYVATNKIIKDQSKKIADLEAKLAESEKPKEIRFNGFVVDCNYDEARKVLQEDLLKMQAENKRLKEHEELSNYAKCILENKKLEEDLELSEKCCVKYEQEIQELKQQLAEKEKEIEKYRNFNVIFVGRRQGKTQAVKIKIKDLQNQTAIAELEKAKEIFGRVKWYHGYCSFGEVKYFDNKLVSWTDVEKEIDNQIKLLKGE